MIKYVFIFVVCCILSASLSAHAQQRAISGKVVDKDTALPIQGATVKVANGVSGTKTAEDGSFRLTISSTDTVSIEISSLGYALFTEVISAGQSSITAMLTPATQTLEDVVVVGYGTSRRKDLTGAISVVEGETIAKRQTTQISQALQGAVPGVMVTRTSSSPGSSTNIKIRGITTIGNSDPLVIVDGVPVNSIDDVNPGDVESLNVLKDAASAAIYGSRAAAGVVLITTKRAKADQFSAQYNYEYGVEKPTVLPEYLGVERYMQVYNEMQWNDGGNGANQYPTYSPDFINSYRELNKTRPASYPITDWNGIILKNYAPRETHVLSLDGGSGKLRTRASVGYDKTDGLYTGLGWQRYTTRINNDLNISEHVSFNIDANMRHVQLDRPIKDPMYFSRIAAPIYHAGWSDGTVGEGKNGANDWAMINNGGFNQTDSTLFAGRIGINVTPITGLKITGLVAPMINYTKQKVFAKAVEWHTAVDPAVVGGYLSDANTTSLAERRNEDFSITYQAFATYNKQIGDHYFDVMAGSEQLYRKVENVGASRDQYDLTEFPYLDIGPLDLRDNDGNAYEYAYQSYFGRLGYNFKDKYLLQMNIRTDGSSRFAKQHRWGVFPSVSAGWVISQENFFNVPAVSFLKLRGSWGRLGNERIGNYPYQSTINFYNALFYNGGQITSEQSAALSRYAVQDISWETTQSYDVGLDVNFFDNRLQLTADYYRKETRDMLLVLQIPMFLGFENPDQNAGKMYARGWDLDLKWSDRIGDFGYNVAFNLSDSRSVMGTLAGTEFLGDQVKIEGSEFNEWYGYRASGLYQSHDQLTGSATTSSAVSLGDIQYQDISGPDGIPDGKISPEYDRVFLGGSLPRYLFGGSIGASFKGFDFNVDFSGVGKSRARLSPLMARPFTDNWGNVPAIIEGRYWSLYSTPEQRANAAYPRVSSNSNANNYVMSDFWLMDGSYFRIKNVTLGYTFDQDWLTKIRLQHIRLFGAINDCAVFSHFPKGWDPEMGSSAYPITSSFVFGVVVKY